MLLAAVTGLLIGWLLHTASDRVPRLVMSHPTSLPIQRSSLALGILVASYTSGRGISESTRQLSAISHFWLHLAVETISAGVLAALWGRFGPSWEGMLLAGAYIFFALVTLIDLKYRLVPNLLVYPAIAATLLFQVMVASESLSTTLVGGGLAFSIFYLTARLRPGDLGGGDVKLALLIGLVLGFPRVLWALLVGAGIGGIVAVFLLIHLRDRNARIPYAPFLSTGFMVALLYTPLVFDALSR
jgi:leader peptidase (prepilin peptidase)/N-methyltransferase